LSAAKSGTPDFAALNAGDMCFACVRGVGPLPRQAVRVEDVLKRSPSARHAFTTLGQSKLCGDRQMAN
jgi:hypothetical protein